MATKLSPGSEQIRLQTRWIQFGAALNIQFVQVKPSGNARLPMVLMEKYAVLTVKRTSGKLDVKQD